MQPSKKKNYDKKQNPLYAFKSLHSTPIKPISNALKEAISRFKSTEKKQYHYPIIYRNASTK